MKATGLLGGAAFLTTAIGMVRGKALAVLVGPAGTGLMGLYGSATGFVGAITSLGIGTAGVRAIADAMGTGDERKAAVAFVTVRRAALLTGVFGAAIQVLAADQLSLWLFKTREHAWAIRLLAITLLLQAISGGQQALIQGARRIKEQATQSVAAALGGVVAAITLVGALGTKGILPLLVAAALIGLAASWWVSRRVSLPSIEIPWTQSLRQSKALFSLGLAFTVASLSTTATSFFLVGYVSRNYGVATSGLYQAAWGLSGVYAGYVFGAMSADYFPRLITLASSPDSMVAAMRRQGEVALLMATPGIAATLVSGGVLLRLFYSSEYLGGYPVLRWLLVAVFLRVVCWPVAYVFLARGQGGLFLGTELFGNGLSIALSLGLSQTWGVVGVAVGQAGTYVVYSIVVYLLARRSVGFSFSGTFWGLLLASGGVIAMSAFLGGGGLTQPSTWVGVALVAASGAAAVVLLSRRLGIGLPGAPKPPRRGEGT